MSESRSLSWSEIWSRSHFIFKLLSQPDVQNPKANKQKFTQTLLTGSSSKHVGMFLSEKSSMFVQTETLFDFLRTAEINKHMQLFGTNFKGPRTSLCARINRGLCAADRVKIFYLLSHSTLRTSNTTFP